MKKSAAGSPPAVIGNIQLLRAFAAFGVVFFHTNFRLIESVHTDFQGVSLFFVISGFIMCHIVAAKSPHFLRQRLLRVVPLYWLMTLVAFVGYLTGYAINHGQLHVEGNGGLPGLLRSLLFIPYAGPSGDYFPYLAVGWTLNLEMVFYLLIAACLPWAKRHAVLAAGFLLLLVKWLPGHSPLLGFYSHEYTSSFILGIAVYYVWTAELPWLRSLLDWLVRQPVLLPLLTGAVAAVLVGFNILGHTSYPLVALLVLLALLLYSAGRDCRVPGLLLLGDASYSLYLVHVPCLEALQMAARHGLWLDFQHSVAGMLLAMVVCGTAGVLVFRWVERPLLARLRTRFA